MTVKDASVVIVCAWPLELWAMSVMHCTAIAPAGVPLTVPV
jgi:hypothetical protein